MEQSTNKIADAMKLITDALREDKLPGSYYYSWQANIAMSIVDEYMNTSDIPVIDYQQLHEVANNAAKRFLDLLCSELETNTQTV